MAKVKVTKVTETVGPGGRILTDEQVEQWSQFAEKNQNLNFDQKWDTFLKSNPQFGASKSDVQNALLKHRRALTDMSNVRTEQGYVSAPKTGILGEKESLVSTGDVFTPILRDGKVVGRHTEDMELSSLYPKEPNPESAYLSKIFLSRNQVPSVDRIQKGSGLIDKQTGIVKFLYDDGREFAADLNDLEKIPEYNQLLNEQYSVGLRSLKPTSESKILRVKK